MTLQMPAEPTALLQILGDVVVRLDHVGIAVRDLDAGISHYQRSHQATLHHREVNEAQEVAEAMLSLPDEVFELQLLAPLTPESTIARFIDKHGEVVQQLAYTVTSLDEAVRVLRENDVEPLYLHAQAGTRNSRINFVHPRDAGGVLIELVEH